MSDENFMFPWEYDDLSVTERESVNETKEGVCII